MCLSLLFFYAVKLIDNPKLPLKGKLTMLDKIIAHFKELYITDPDLAHLEPVKPNPIIIPDYSLGTAVASTF